MYTRWSFSSDPNRVTPIVRGADDRHRGNYAMSTGQASDVDGTDARYVRERITKRAAEIGGALEINNTVAQGLACRGGENVR